MLPVVYLGQLPIAMYGLSIVCGVLLAGLIALVRGRRRAIKGEDIILCGLYMVVGGIVGGKALYLLAHLRELATALRLYSVQPELLISMLTGGFLFFGGLAGGLFMFWRYCTAYQLDMAALAACFIPVAPLVQACGRLGCFAAGCCYGIPYDGPLAVIYTVSPVAPHNIPLFPVQPLSAALNLLLFAALSVYTKKRQADARLALVYIIAYSLGRFALDFLRGDYAGPSPLGLSWSQWTCLVVLPLALYLYAKKSPKRQS